MKKDIPFSCKICCKPHDKRLSCQDADLLQAILEGLITHENSQQFAKDMGKTTLQTIIDVITDAMIERYIINEAMAKRYRR